MKNITLWVGLLLLSGCFSNPEIRTIGGDGSEELQPVVAKSQRQLFIEGVQALNGQRAPSRILETTGNWDSSPLAQAAGAFEVDVFIKSTSADHSQDDIAGGFSEALQTSYGQGSMFRLRSGSVDVRNGGQYVATGIFYNNETGVIRLGVRRNIDGTFDFEVSSSLAPAVKLPRRGLPPRDASHVGVPFGFKGMYASQGKALYAFENFRALGGSSSSSTSSSGGSSSTSSSTSSGGSSTSSTSSGGSSTSSTSSTSSGGMTSSSSSSSSSSSGGSSSSSSGGYSVQAQSISQYGITWSFDREYTTGQFANGDYWVVGPVTIVGISPLSSNVGGRIKNGSMLNPSPGDQQGYDNQTRRTTYNASNNVGYNVSASNPLNLAGNSSLVSTISVDAAQSRPQVRVAAVLTVLNAVPPQGSFRPPYSGTDKTVRFNKSQLDYSRLLRLQGTASAPTLAAVEARTRRVWLDHQAGWTGRELRAVDNGPAYGRDIGATVGDVALLLHLDYTHAQKENLMIYLTQIGIDNFGVVQNGGQDNWVPNGGHASGRKYPILHAGYALSSSNDSVAIAMRNIGQDNRTHFGEDSQTFYVRETSPGVFNNGHGGYTAAHLGLAEYGIRHATDPSRDDVSWDASYRVNTGNAWSGFVLAVRMLGLKSAWNHDVLFDYQDRYMTETLLRGQPDWQRAWSGWQAEMWDANRGQF